MDWYDALIKILLGWLEPYINAALDWIAVLINWDLQLYPHWKHVFVLLGLYFFTKALTSFRAGAFGSGIFQLMLGLTVALTTAVAAGTISLSADAGSDNAALSQFFLASTPLAGYFIFQFTQNIWGATFTRQWNARNNRVEPSSWFAFFVNTTTRTIRLSLAGLMVVGIGSLMPFIQALPGPGLALFGGLIVLLAAWNLWFGVVRTRNDRARSNLGEIETWSQTYWRQGDPNVGAAMVGVIIWAINLAATNAGLGLVGL